MKMVKSNATGATNGCSSESQFAEMGSTLGLPSDHN